MNDYTLTIESLKEKIAKVTTDMEQLRLTGDSSRKLEVLSEYKQYLEEEIQFLKNEHRNSTT